MRTTVSRRQVLLGAASGTGLAVLSGCGFFSTNPEQQENGQQQQKGKEAPMLAQQVESGSLPAVEERLPKTPRVIEPLENTGVYGGALRTVLASTDQSWITMSVTNDHLVTWDPTWSEIIANVAESYEVLEDGRVYVFHLREGTRWSDGEPFTAADLTWWYENILLEKQLTPVVPSSLKVGEEPVEVTANGDLEVTFTFSSPNAIFLDEMTVHFPSFWLFPRHYLEQFHKKFNPDLSDDWAQDFLAKMDRMENVDLPVLSAWVAQNPHGDGGRQVWERNPYYWKVDTDGSQLPYIDEWRFNFFNEPEALLVSAANGDVDFYMRTEITVAKNRPVLSDGQETGNYTLVSIKHPNHNTIAICLNLTSKDPAKRTMYRKRDFRIGLSHAIDRQQIIDLVYQRQGRPWQTAPRPDVPFYSGEEFGTQYTEFDLDLARQHLTAAGYDQTDSNGSLLGEDGKPIVITVLCQARYPDMIDAMEFIKATWKKVGIELRIETVSPELVSERLTANDYDCTLDKGELGYIGLVSDPRWLFATSGASYAPLWSNWYEGGSPKEAPPAAMQKQMSLYREGVIGSADQDTQYAALEQIIDIAKEEFWTIGVSRPAGAYCIVANRLHNVPGDDQMWLAFKPPYPAVTNPTTYYLDPQ